MTKTEYLAELERRLKLLSETDRKDALEYYEEYLSDAESDDVDIVAKLGTPNEVAAKLLVEFAARDKVEPKEKEKSGIKMAWAVILAIFAAPIGLPIAIALGVVAISLLVTLLALVFSFGVTGIALGGAGIAYLVFAFIGATQSVASAILLLGLALIMLGLFIMFIKVASYIIQKSFHGLSKWVSKTIIRRSDQ